MPTGRIPFGRDQRGTKEAFEVGGMEFFQLSKFNKFIFNNIGKLLYFAIDLSEKLV